jgi:hypothetical protein
MKALLRSVAGVNRLLSGRVEHERKVRAAQDTPLVKVPAIGDSRIWKKKTTAIHHGLFVGILLSGKGEKVV